MSAKAKYAHLLPPPGDIKERLNRLAGFLERHPVRPAYIFGSSAHLPEKSNDVDIAVLPSEGFSYLSLRWTTEHGLPLGLRILFHIADHILTNVYERTVETYEGLLAELCSVGVVSQSLYRQLKGAGGLRNVLVHEYLEVDLNEVANALSRAPQVFRFFVAEVLSWLSQRQKGG